MKIFNIKSTYTNSGFLSGVQGLVFFWHNRKRHKIPFNADFYEYYNPNFMKGEAPSKKIATSKKMCYFGFKTITGDFQLERALKIKTFKKLARILRAEIKKGSLAKQRMAEIFFNQPLLLKAS